MFVHKVQRARPRDKPAQVPTFCNFAQNILLCRHGGHAGPDSARAQIFQNNVAGLDHQVEPRQRIEGFRQGTCALAHDADAIHDHEPRAEIQELGAFLRVEHALDRVDFAFSQGLDGVRPVAELDADVQADFARDGFCQIHVKAARTAAFVEIFERREITAAADDDGAVGGKLHRCEPFGVQAAAGSVGNGQRKTFVQQRQGRVVALPHRETELLGETGNGRVQGFQILQGGFLKNSSGDEVLGHHRVTSVSGQQPEGVREGRRRDQDNAIIFPPQELIRVVPPHYADTPAAQVCQRLNAGRVLTDHDGAVHGQVGHGEVERRLPFRRAPDQRQRMDLAALQHAAHLGPGAGAELDRAPHLGERFAHKLHGEAVRPAVVMHKAERRVIDLAAGQDVFGRLLLRGQPTGQGGSQTSQTASLMLFTAQPST